MTSRDVDSDPISPPNIDHDLITTALRGSSNMIAGMEDDGEEGEVVIEDEEEEADEVKLAPDPGSPSPQEVEDHRKDHMPYRSWCEHCVKGRGTGMQHRRVEKKSSNPRVGIDYFFITESDELRKTSELGTSFDDHDKIEQARTDGKLTKCLVVRCWETKAVFAHIVPQKGADEEKYVAGLVCADIEWLGHVKLVLKSDNEEAILALARQVVTMIGEKHPGLQSITTETSAAYDSKSNGGTEVGIRLVRGVYRTLRLCLEARIGKKISTRHPIMAWLLSHACLVLNSRMKGKDGLTAWHRARGRPFRQSILGFGESVMFKLPSKGKAAPGGNMEAKFQDGVLLGYHRRTNTYILGTADGICTSRSIQRRPHENRWNAALIEQMRATPWNTRERSEVRVRFAEAPRDPPPTPSAHPVPKRFRINLADLRTYGFTEGCKQCQQFERYGKTPNDGGSHTEACRKRILAALLGTPKGRARVDAYEEKVNEALAERLQAEERIDGPPAEVPAQEEIHIAQEETSNLRAMRIVSEMPRLVDQ